MSKTNRIYKRLNNKLSNIFERVINERQLLTEKPGCNSDWDCGDGKWCGPHPPCGATACMWSNKGECACINKDCTVESVIDGGVTGIEDEEIMAKHTAGGDCYCVRHNGNQDDEYTPGVNRCTEWSADCGGRSVDSSDVRIAEARLLREFYKCDTEGNGGSDGEGKNGDCLGGAGTCVAYHDYTTQGTCCYSLFGDCHGDSMIGNGGLTDTPMDAPRSTER